TRILSPRVAGSSAGGATRLCVGLSVDASPVTEGRSGTRALPAFGLVDAGKRSTDSRDTTSRRAGRRSVTRALPGPPPAEVADRVDDRHGVGDPASSRLRSSRMSAISRPSRPICPTYGPSRQYTSSGWAPAQTRPAPGGPRRATYFDPRRTPSRPRNPPAIGLDSAMSWPRRIGLNGDDRIPAADDQLERRRPVCPDVRQPRCPCDPVDRRRGVVDGLVARRVLRSPRRRRPVRDPVRPPRYRAVGRVSAGGAGLRRTRPRRGRRGSARRAGGRPCAHRGDVDGRRDRTTARARPPRPVRVPDARLHESGGVDRPAVAAALRWAEQALRGAASRAGLVRPGRRHRLRRRRRARVRRRAPVRRGSDAHARHAHRRADAQCRVEHDEPPSRRGGPAGAGPPRRHPRVDSRRPRNGGPALSVRARGGAGRRNRRRSAAAARRRRPRAPAARHVGRIRLRAPGAHANALAVCISITRARNGGTSADRKEAAGRSVSEGWEGAGRAPRGRRKPSTWWGCSGSSPPRDWRVTVKILLVIFAPDFRRSEAAGGWPGVRAPPLTLPRSRTSLPGCHCRVSALAVSASHASAAAGLWSRGSLHQAAGNASLTGNRPRKLRSVDDAGLESRRRSVEPRGEVMRKLLLGMAAMLVALSAAALAIASSSGDDSLLPKEQRYVSDSQTSSKNGTKSGSSLNMAVVGTNTLGDRGFNGDV